MEKIGEAEQDLIHALVLGALGRLDIVLDGFIGPLFGRLLAVLLVPLQLRGQRGVLLLLGLKDLLVEATRLEAVEALLFGVELAQPEVEVGLLGVVIGRNLEQPVELGDLPVGDLLNLRLLLSDELFHRQNRPGLFLLLGWLLWFRQLGLGGSLDFQFFLLELSLSENRP